MNLRPLVELMRKELSLHEKIDLAQRDCQKFIALGDPNHLLESSETLETLSRQASVIERQRREMTEQLARHLGVDDRLPLRDLIQFLPEENRGELEEVGSSLRARVHSVRHTNRANTVMLERALDTFRNEMASFINEKPSAMYAPQGRTATKGVPRAGLNVRA